MPSASRGGYDPPEIFPCSLGGNVCKFDSATAYRSNHITIMKINKTEKSKKLTN